MSLKLYYIRENTCLVSDVQKPPVKSPEEPTART